MVGFGAGYAQIQKQLLQEMEFPYGVADEIGRLIWMNQSFQRIVQLNNNAHKNLGTLFPGIDRQFPKNQRTSQVHSEYLGRKYQITIKAVSIRDIVETVVDEEDQGKKAPMMYAVYLSDETQMLEFIDMEHTPKNLLLRAVKRQEGSKKQPEELKVCMEAYHVKPTLADLLTEKEEP